MEVSLVGDMCNPASRDVIPLKGCAVHLLKVKRDSKNRTLQYTKSTLVLAAPEDIRELGDITAVPGLQLWSRCSIDGYVSSEGDVEAADGKHHGRWMREITAANVQCQGLRVRIRVDAIEDTEFLEEGVHVQINFAKVMSTFVYCDVDDLSEVVATGMDNTSRPDPNAVTEVCWPPR